MTKRQQILCLLAEHPDITNEELAEEMGISVQYAKTEISVLKKEGYIEVEKIDGNRMIHVLRGMPVMKVDFKKAIYEELLEGYMEDFRNAETRSDRKEVGTLILRIIEKI